MPKMCEIPQLVLAPLNARPIVEHFLATHSLSTVTDKVYKKENKPKCHTLNDEI